MKKIRASTLASRKNLSKNSPRAKHRERNTQQTHKVPRARISFSLRVMSVAANERRAMRNNCNNKNDDNCAYCAIISLLYIHMQRGFGLFCARCADGLKPRAREREKVLEHIFFFAICILILMIGVVEDSEGMREKRVRLV
jgi:hypothetical protein